MYFKNLTKYEFEYLADRALPTLTWDHCKVINLIFKVFV